jgi:hypothetical protein
MSGLVENLRNEVVESQKARIDLLKWKVILAATLGATGLGIGDKGHVRDYLVLGLIPLACAYVDVVCAHNSLRIYVIARYLRGVPADEGAAYEKLCLQNRATFRLEDFALVWATLGATLAVIGYSTRLSFEPLELEHGELAILPFVGLAISLYAWWFERTERNKLDNDERPATAEPAA